jgi:hypothetical protein
MKYPILVAALALVASVSCSPVTGGEPATDTLSVGPIISGAVDATIRLVRIEGGCWVIDTNDKNHLPTNLPAEYRVDGLRVRVRFHELRNAASVCQLGPVVTIETISRR